MLLPIIRRKRRPLIEPLIEPLQGRTMEVQEPHNLRVAGAPATNLERENAEKTSIREAATPVDSEE
jgi:hypothetical protein